MADRLGKSQGQISHLIGENPIKNIGPKIARQIEESFHKSHGCMDHLHAPASIREEQTNGTDIGHALPFAKPDHIDIPLMNAGGAMGPGRMAPDQEEIIEQFAVNLAWLRKYTHISHPDNLAIITGYGDSMEDTFADGDLLLVDRGVTEVRIDAVYVLARNEDLFIKRLQRVPDGTLLMISDNDRYKPYSIKSSEWPTFRVLGRVILAMAKKIL